MRNNKIFLSFEGSSYHVDERWYFDLESCVELPDGRLVVCDSWLESCPPQPVNVKVIKFFSTPGGQVFKAEKVVEDNSSNDFRLEKLQKESDEALSNIDINCESPEKDIVIKRKALWAMTIVLASIPLECRDSYYKYAQAEVKRLLYANPAYSS
jgi:hypothetical protein